MIVIMLEAITQRFYIFFLRYVTLQKICFAAIQLYFSAYFQPSGFIAPYQYHFCAFLRKQTSKSFTHT